MKFSIAPTETVSFAIMTWSCAHQSSSFYVYAHEKWHFWFNFGQDMNFLISVHQASHKGDTIQHQLQSMMVFYSVCKTCHQRQKKAAVVLVWQPLFCYCLVALPSIWQDFLLPHWDVPLFKLNPIPISKFHWQTHLYLADEESGEAQQDQSKLRGLSQCRQASAKH